MTPEELERLAREADPEFGNSAGDMPDAICGMPATMSPLPPYCRWLAEPLP